MAVNVGSMVPWVQNNKELYTCKIDANYCTFTLPKYFTIGNDKLYYLYVIYNHNSQSCDHIIAHSQRKVNFKWSCSGRLGNNSKLDSVLFHQCFMFEKTFELSATQFLLLKENVSLSALRDCCTPAVTVTKSTFWCFRDLSPSS